MTTPEKRMRGHLGFLYSEEQARHIWPELKTSLDEFRRRNPQLLNPQNGYTSQIDEQDAILITYGDQVSEPGQPPLHTLADFLETHLTGTIRGVHILPFFPYSSDDGFSVVDYYKVDPELGTWEDIELLARNFRLMFDLVINHISRQSEWFKAFQREEPPYRDYFIAVDPDADLSMVVRPRALPLLTAVETRRGRRHVWTTFSDDQMDLNFANPEVLLEMIAVLLFYAEKGAEVIRLDAIAYLWKEIGTASIHLPQTHRVVKLLRAVLDSVAPGVLLITETNVPHSENISYFGDPLAEASRGPTVHSGDQAQMVYQFALAPLVLHGFLAGDARKLSEWAASLDLPFRSVTFFNFIASHDGIGVRPAEGILDADEIQQLVEQIRSHGGRVSYRANQDGTRSVYELNTTLYDALNDPKNPRPETDEARFLASQVIMLSLAGVPGIYIHSLFGSRNCQSCVEETGRARSINRKKFPREELEASLADKASREARIFSRYKQLLHLRRSHAAFHPSGDQKVLFVHSQIFAVLRVAPDRSDSVLCLVNVSDHRLSASVDTSKTGLAATKAWTDLIGGSMYTAQKNHLPFELDGYQYMWLAPQEG